jgi:hypothetical protein
LNFLPVFMFMLQQNILVVLVEWGGEGGPGLRGKRLGVGRRVEGMGGMRGGVYCSLRIKT